MKNKYWISIIIVLIIVFGILLICDHHNNNNVEIQQPTTFIKTIDSLNNKINVLENQKDSIKHSISDSKIKVTVRTKEYEKKLISVTNQPIASDVEFFTNYLSQASK